MRKLSKKQTEKVLDCIRLLQNGDKIECRGNYLVVYNSSGCEIDSIDLLHI